GVDVELVPAPHVDFFASPQPQRTTTNDAGIFRFDELPFGQYVVRFTDADGLYLASDHRAAATTTAVTPTAAVTPTTAVTSTTTVTDTASAASEPALVTLDRNEEVSMTAQVFPASLITGSIIIDGEIAGMGGQVAAYTLDKDAWLVGGSGNIV